MERKLGRKKELAERKIIRKRRVRELTGYGDTTIWRKEKKGEFPRRIQLSPMAVGWFEDEILAWIRLRVRGMGKPPPLPKARRKTEAAASG